MPGLDVDDPVHDPDMLRLATVRSHDQYNTTIYSYNDRYRGVYNDRMVLFMNIEDRLARGLEGSAGQPGDDQRRWRAAAHRGPDRAGLPDAARRAGRLLPRTEPVAAAGLLRPDQRHARGQVDPGADACDGGGDCVTRIGYHRRVNLPGLLLRWMLLVALVLNAPALALARLRTAVGQPGSLRCTALGRDGCGRLLR
jgi:hypothetical protein